MTDGEKRISADALHDEAAGAVTPCQLEVMASDRRPIGLQTPSPVSDGRYKLLAPGWTAEAVRANGAWHLSGLVRQPDKDLSKLTTREQKLRNAEIKERLESFGGAKFAKSFFKNRADKCLHGRQRVISFPNPPRRPHSFLGRRLFSASPVDRMQRISVGIF